MTQDEDTYDDATGAVDSDFLGGLEGEEAPEEATETIGLLGGRGSKGDEPRPAGGRTKRLHEILSIARKYDILHGLTPRGLRKMLEELGPTFVKAGQILSMRSEILPESFCRELAKLRTDVEPMDRELVLSTLREEYDRPIEDLFDAIDDVPLGSASVAQVHKARLVTGELVAIKVQRPRVKETMAQDISIMRSLARQAGRFMQDDQVLDFQSVIDELWQSFREETDFLVEARSLAEFGRDNQGVVYVGCPRPYFDLCTEHVVVMDYVDGISLEDTAALVHAGYDLEEIGTKLVENYARQMLDVGFFHADPHPGNLIISGGKICFIDLGMMGRLSAHDRAALRDMIFAVGERDTARLADGLLRFAKGDVAGVDRPRLLAELDLIVDNYGSAEISELDVGAFLNSLLTMARRNGIELPGTVTMLVRMLMTLEGVVDRLMPEASMVEMIARHIRANTTPLAVAKDEVKRLSLEGERAAHALLKAGGRADTAMEMLTRGQLRFGVDLAGTEDPMSDFARSADHLTMGIIIAGLFIGSSVIYYARVKPLIFGIPVLGFVGFVLALALALWLFHEIRKGSRRRRR